MTSTFFGLLIEQSQAANIKNSTTTSAAILLAEKDRSQLNMQNRSGSAKSTYKMDGTTSASKLVAKRSHSVSKHDETGLAIFLGVIVVGVIVFFLRPFSKKK